MDDWLKRDHDLEREILEQEEKIRNCHKVIEQKRFEQLINNIHLEGARLFKATSRLSSFKFIEERHELKRLGVVMYPIYLKRKCFYPPWAKNIYACSFAPLDDNSFQDLILAIAKSMEIGLKEAKEVVEKYKLVIPATSRTDVEDGNIVVDWELGKRLEKAEDGNLMENLARIKYILVMVL